jgi:hypothetical protein
MKMALATLPQADRIASVLHHYLALLHLLFQFFLVINKQSMDLAVCFVADSVNLRAELPPGRCGILIEQSLNPVMVLLKQRPDSESTPDLS